MVLSPEVEDLRFAGSWGSTASSTGTSARDGNEPKIDFVSFDGDHDANRKPVLSTSNNLLRDPLRVCLRYFALVRPDPDAVHLTLLVGRVALARPLLHAAPSASHGL